MDRQHGFDLQKQIEINNELLRELSAVKDEHIMLQIRIEEQRREIVALKTQMRKKNSKLSLYKEIVSLQSA